MEFPLKHIRKIQETVHFLDTNETHWSSVSLLERSLTKKQSKEISFQERLVNMNDLSFPKHEDRGKTHAKMASIAR